MQLPPDGFATTKRVATNYQRQTTWPRIAEGLGLIVIMFFGAQLMFGLWGIFADRDVPMTLIFFPLIGWAGLRFGPRGAATLVALISAFALAVAGLGVGPFATFPVPFTQFLLFCFLALARQFRDAVGRRNRCRHAARGPRADLRAVLHHQGRRQGHRPRPVNRLRHRPPERRAHIAVSSELGLGTTFRMYLPRSEAPPQAAVDPSVEKMPDGTEHILLVEDDPSVRRLSKEPLVRLGYSVTEAASGRAGLALGSDDTLATAPTSEML